MRCPREQARKLRENLSIFKDGSVQFKVAGTACHGFTRESFFVCYLTTSGYFLSEGKGA
jgi:hypothetical protein